MNIVFVWVWWIWISAIAKILKDLWYDNIIWIDKYENQITEKLKDEWIKTIIWHWNYDIKYDDFVIYSDATINSPEIQKSLSMWKQENKKWFHKSYSYFEFLWEISKHFKTISIAWTHGKSTTSAMIIDTLSQLDNNFWIWITWALMLWIDNQNFFINNNIKSDIKNIFDHIIYWKNNEFNYDLIKKYNFVIEADEFNKHFLHLDTDYAIITNIELDHSDVYWNFENYFNTFIEFSNKVKHTIFWLKEDNILCDLKNIIWDKIKLIDIKNFDFKYIFGRHNQKNSSLAYNIIENTIWKNNKIEEHLNNFKWLWRRIEFLIENKNWTKIYTDYWHHPSELNAVFDAFKKNFPDKSLTAIFQPHQARRVVEFWWNFIDVLKQFDNIIIYNIYTARENLNDLLIEFKNKDFNDINTVKELWNLFANKCNWKYTEDFDHIKTYIDNWKENEIIINFSAWDLDYQLRKYLILI